MIQRFNKKTELCKGKIFFVEKGLKEWGDMIQLRPKAQRACSYNWFKVYVSY